jgi:hypothetical protein
VHDDEAPPITIGNNSQQLATTILVDTAAKKLNRPHHDTINFFSSKL